MRLGERKSCYVNKWEDRFDNNNDKIIDAFDWLLEGGVANIIDITCVLGAG